jgi:hypothetical protein
MLHVKRNRPDVILAEFAWHDFECIVAHNDLGYRCGYIRLEAGHPWRGLNKNDIDTDCHGGLTYSAEDEDDQSWWLGFDCGHLYDAPDPELVVQSWNYITHVEAQVRSTWYVMQELISLAEQAQAASSLANN